MKTLITIALITIALGFAAGSALTACQQSMINHYAAIDQYAAGEVR